MWTDGRTVQIPVEYAEMWAGMVFPFYPSGPRHYAGAVVGSYHILLIHSTAYSACAKFVSSEVTSASRRCKHVFVNNEKM